MDFMNSQTYKNLEKAFNAENHASGKYSLFAHKAHEDGYQQIGNIFDETAHNEMEHAEIWLKKLNNGQLPSTYDMLNDSAKGEYYEWSTMYKDFADVARKEGFMDIANLFDGVGNIEKHHDRRYRMLMNNIKNEEVFCKKRETLWICLNCGNVISGVCAPDVCPVCSYPQGYYELLCENY